MPNIISDQWITFNDIPAINQTYTIVNESVDSFKSGMYTLIVTAVNQLNNVTALNSTFYIEG